MVGNKIVSTLRSDGKVYPVAYDVDKEKPQYSSFLNSKRYSSDSTHMFSSDNMLGDSTCRSQATIVDLGKSLLQYSRDNDLKGVQQMMTRGAPFSSDWLGMTAIHFAAMNDRYEICETLINGGINKDSRTKVDRTPLHLAAFYGHERIVQLLLSKKCSINPKDMLRMTPLHWAVEKRHKNIVKLLLKHNADVSLISKFGKTPIALAVLTEQADLLQELEKARQLQQSKKYNEEREKETSEAVNSIIGFETCDVIDEPDSTRRIDVDTDDEIITQKSNEPTIEHLDGIKDTGVLDNSTINLLKSHGISMMQDDDSPNNLLTTALQNGRQLVLSEGGRMLLNEARRLANPSKFMGKFSREQQLKSTSSSNNSNIVPINKPNSNDHQSNLGIKLRPNIISKAKDAHQNKEIRIISINDFKKLCGSGNIRSLQKLPAINKTNIIKHIKREDTDKKKIHPNTFQLHNNLNKQNNRIISTNIKEEENESCDDVDLPPNIVKVGTTSDSEPHSDSDFQHSVERIPAKRIDNLRGSFNLSQGDKLVSINKPPSQIGSTASYKEIKNGKHTVIPLLTLPEICRQMLELRKQNEELRRKFEMAQKEKEEIRQRLERLESILLVEQMNDACSEM